MNKMNPFQNSWEISLLLLKKKKKREIENIENLFILLENI